MRRLSDDCCIDMTMTCPVAAFLGPKQIKPRAKPAGFCVVKRDEQPTTNPTIPPGCRKAVEAFNTKHPTMSLMTLIKRGNISLKDVTLGGKGDCASFGLLSRCSVLCAYNHVVCTPTAERQAAISAAIGKAMATIARGVPGS